MYYITVFTEYETCYFVSRKFINASDSYET